MLRKKVSKIFLDLDHLSSKYLALKRLSAVQSFFRGALLVHLLR